ncbi:MAG: DUF3530 family protein [Marinobacter sp.]
MNNWFERGFIRLLLILVSGFVVGIPTALAQDAGEPQDEEAGEPAADRKRAMISSALDSEAIAAKWPDATVWLEPPEEDRVLALFEPEADTPAKGALVILADEGQSAATGLAGALRRPMARAGWAVMTLGLEPPPYAVQQYHRQQAAASPETSERSGDNDNAEDTEAGGSVMIDVMDSVDVEELEDQYRNRIQKILAVAVSNLLDRGYETVAVAGVGKAAGHVAGMAPAGADDVSALIWIAPVFDRIDSETLPEWLSEAGQIRVLELHSTRVSEVMEGAGPSSPKEREAAFRREEITSYSRQPVAMPERPEARDAPQLANRLSAWLASDR